ncbi:SDR family NAD(P)-dependent oxidoreductase [Labrys monachus]|uniref:NAD(P)-dependent dehydrogenase (Short-subunit alcohol dehydrogenase family) n=1 Tax=Labrys monachus TaxID=217067 RepID=A0ABU0FJW6_9HYPH|nr:SDR family oxidoreductase [Labrys monachus]MDQ0394901.1 NAD(P)-dependent dehydrogenase (short-subunit alcohol dehydrogenase family) [Labrys monachus]
MTIFATYPSLASKVVLITGGASGIGEAHVEHFCAAGARVGFIDRNIQAAESLVARIVAAGGNAPHFLHADLRDIEATQGAIAGFAAAHGDVDVLINNAAHDERHDIETVSVAYWDERIALNLRHLFFCAQAVTPGMIRKGGGSIVNVGSFSWRVGLGGMPIYVAAKAGIEGLTRGLARDLGAHDISVNTLVPGWVMTQRQIDLWVTPEVEEELAQRQCLKSRVTPADIARMALWLAAADSRMCTAQSFVVDGGWS